VNLTSIIRSILQPDVAVAAGPVLSNQGFLFAQEYEAIRDALPVRRQEFIAGRSYARSALRQIGGTEQSIPRADDRSPIWPLGYVGSISHTHHHCGAIVAESKLYLTLGLDIESDDPLEPELYSLIGSDRERRTLSFPLKTEVGPVDRAKLVFSAKESVFKACNPVTKVWLDFQEVEVELDGEERMFRATLVSGGQLLPCTDALVGQWAVLENHIVTALCVRRV
jgi:4'-phosphopantetheinyl transferase EntD